MSGLYNSTASVIFAVTSVWSSMNWKYRKYDTSRTTHHGETECPQKSSEDSNVFDCERIEYDYVVSIHEWEHEPAVDRAGQLYFRAL